VLGRITIEPEIFRGKRAMRQFTVTCGPFFMAIALE